MKGVLSPYQPNSWFNPFGAKRKQKELMEKMPNLKGCLALTLTCDPCQFTGPAEAFDKGNDRIRRMKDRLKRGVNWESKFVMLEYEYLRKLEFHESGWPHFHLILKTRRFLDVMLLNHLWGYGLVKVQRIKKDYQYLFKYVCKDPEELPEWVKERKVIRIMQPSRHFFEEKETSQEEPPQKPMRKKIPSVLTLLRKRRITTTIGERILKWQSMGMFKTDKGEFHPVYLAGKYDTYLFKNLMQIAQEGRYLGRKQIAFESKSELSRWLNSIQATTGN